MWQWKNFKNRPAFGEVMCTLFDPCRSLAVCLAGFLAALINWLLSEKIIDWLIDWQSATWLWVYYCNISIDPRWSNNTRTIIAIIIIIIITTNISDTRGETNMCAAYRLRTQLISITTPAAAPAAIATPLNGRAIILTGRWWMRQCIFNEWFISLDLVSRISCQ